MRKRYIAIPLCVCLVFALFGCTSGAKATGNEETGMVSEMLAQSDITGPGTEAEKTEVKTETEALPTEPGYGFFAGYLRGAGRAEKGYDGNAFVQSEAAERIFSDLYYYAAYGLSGQDELAVLSYWRSLGLEKKVYDADDADRMWSVFTPVGEQYDEDHQFPVVFCLHGHGNNIFLAETYGFARLGGSEGFITVVPWAKDEDIIVEEIPRILDVLRDEGYPIDESRIYAVGFSKGGMAAQIVALKYSDIFAAAAPGGCGPFGTDENALPISSGNLNWSFRPEEFENANTMPVLFFGGSCDSMPIDTASVNEWIRLAGANAPEMPDEWFSDQAPASETDVEKFTGLKFDSQNQTEVRQYDGQNYYIGSYYNDAGICTFRAVSVEGAPHWPMPSEAKVVWEFFSQFSRDKDTHELVCTNNTGEEEKENSSGISEVEISFDYARMSTHASNQIAVWVEDADGKLVKTIYVSDFTAGRRGYEKREDALNHWVLAADPTAMSDDEIDAISRATPQAGRLTYSWDLTDESGNRVPEGRYFVKAEGTLYWSSNVVYSADVSTTASEGSLEVTETRSEPDTHDNEDMITGVEMTVLR